MLATLQQAWHANGIMVVFTPYVLDVCVGPMQHESAGLTTHNL